MLGMAHIYLGRIFSMCPRSTVPLPHPALCLGGEPVGAAPMGSHTHPLLVGFSQWEAPAGGRKMEAEPGCSIYSGVFALGWR